MKSNIVILLFCLMFLPVASQPLFAGDGLKPEDVLAKHLASIGSEEARKAVKTRVVQGNASYKILVGGGGETDGKTGLVSDGRKLRFMVKFPTDYKGENFLFDGDKQQFAFSNANQSRSPFSAFVESQDVILRDGLFGGTLSTAWALLDVPGRKAKLVYDGLKKVDGRELHRVTYVPRKLSDAQIQLYFDPETFRHVMTTYNVEVGNNVGRTVTESATLKADRRRLEERFSDFTTVDGITLPTHWNLQFTRELPDGQTTLTQWDLREDDLRNNISLDPRNFQTK